MSKDTKEIDFVVHRRQRYKNYFTNIACKVIQHTWINNNLNNKNIPFEKENI